MSVARPAATVILLRPAPEGFEIFMVKRHGKSGFMPDAWVFPGGRVDDGDRLADHPAVRGGAAAVEQMELSRHDAVPYLIAAVRETFEEAGIWLGSGMLALEERHALDRREATMGEVLDRTGAVVDLDRLRAWAWWVTPEFRAQALRHPVPDRPRRGRRRRGIARRARDGRSRLGTRARPARPA